MKSSIIAVLSFAAMSVVTSVARADIAVYYDNAKPTTDWANAFQGSNKGVQADSNSDARLSQDSISGGNFGEGVPLTIASGDGAFQTFVGDGKRLEGVGFFIGRIINTAGQTVNFSIALIDYGKAALKNSSQLKAGKGVFVETGTLSTANTGRQYYFDFSEGGAKKLVLPTLVKGNTYGIHIIITGQTTGINLYRSTSAEAYEKGVCGTSKGGQLSILNVGKTPPDRDLNFAVYTAPIK